MSKYKLVYNTDTESLELRQNESNALIVDKKITGNALGRDRVLAQMADLLISSENEHKNG